MKKKVNLVKLHVGEGHTVELDIVESLLQRAFTIVPILPKKLEEREDERQEHLTPFYFLSWVLF